MALKLQDDCIEESLSRHLRKYRKLTELISDLEQAQDHHLEVLMEEYPAFAAVVNKLNSSQVTAARLKKELEEHVRETKVACRGEGVSISYSNPLKVEYDCATLVKLHPKAKEIPNLIQEIINTTALECAVAAGWIPEEVVEASATKTPLYKRGRVSTTILKDK